MRDGAERERKLIEAERLGRHLEQILTEPLLVGWRERNLERAIETACAAAPGWERDEAVIAMRILRSFWAGLDDMIEAGKQARKKLADGDTNG